MNYIIALLIATGLSIGSTLVFHLDTFQSFFVGLLFGGFAGFTASVFD